MSYLDLVRINARRNTGPRILWILFNFAYSAIVFLTRRGPWADPGARLLCESLRRGRIGSSGNRVRLRGWFGDGSGAAPVALRVTWTGFVSRVHVMTFAVTHPPALPDAPPDAASFSVEFAANPFLKIVSLEAAFASGRVVSLGDFAIFVFPWDRGPASRQELAWLQPPAEPAALSYEEWRRRADATDPEAARQEVAALARRPLISVVVPVHDPPECDLRRMLDSVLAQWYPDWELCLCDDGSTDVRTRAELLRRAQADARIKTVFADTSQHVCAATNRALSLASGSHVAFLDHDDALTPDALLEVAKALQSGEPDVIYSDEDKRVDGELEQPFFKPGFSPDQLLSHNYFCHLLVVRRELVQRVGGLREGYEGAQDHDLILRVMEQATEVCHIPRVLYHWTATERSTARAASAKPYAWAAGTRALQDAVFRRDLDATVEPGDVPFTYRVRRRIRGAPLVSIVVPFSDMWEVTHRCVRSILDASTYRSIELVLVSNNSSSDETRRGLEALKREDRRIRVLELDVPFNYSRLNNRGTEAARGEHVLYLNNDTEVISPDWLEALIEHSQRPEVGAVGAKLLYPNGTVQHAGVVIGIGGGAGHFMKGRGRHEPGGFSQLAIVRNVSAVTGACLMVKRRLVEEIGGFDETHLPVALNDIDFCLRLRERGYLNVYTPYCQLYHHESLSRGADDTTEKSRRARAELVRFQQRHRRVLEDGDPYYNPNLTLRTEAHTLRDPVPLPGTRVGARFFRARSTITRGGELTARDRVRVTTGQNGDGIGQEIDRLGPWVTGFCVDGVPYGGDYRPEGDPRVLRFTQDADRLGLRADAHILECGSLEGGHTRLLAARFPCGRITSVDVRARNLDKTRFVLALGGIGNVTLVEDDLDDPRTAFERTYDAVFCVGLLYHLRRPAEFLARAARVAPVLWLWTVICDGAQTRVQEGEASGRMHQEPVAHPLSGIGPESFIPTLGSLTEMLWQAGFTGIELLGQEITENGNGPAVLLCARRARLGQEPGPAVGPSLPRACYKQVWEAQATSEDAAKVAVAGYTSEEELDRTARITVRTLERCVGIRPTDVVLEIGAGIGRVGRVLAPLCREWIGADVSAKMVEHLRRRLSDLDNVRGVELGGYDLSPIPSGSVDVVYCTVVFMHLDEWDRYSYIREGYRVLRPGGRMLVDNFNLLAEEGWRVFEQMAAIPPVERPAHISRSSTPHELGEYFRRAGFCDVGRLDEGTWTTAWGSRPSGEATFEAAGCNGSCRCGPTPS